ncbi:uncharacterized protein LOC143022477 [Oratosquilla oratoria]|uniref:uncharacterized protein LOC143022477 n=1 Tax=Oratosquilla oratoria TaxID=337810 RepID=UPI003F77400D
MEQAKVVRRQRKAAVTRHLGTLCRLIAEEDIAGITDRLDRVRTSYNEFESAQDTYQTFLSNDERELEASESWYKETEEEYIKVIKDARAFLKVRTQSEIPCAKSRVDSENSESERLDVSPAELVGILNVPKVELDVFEGNPLEYNLMTIFDELVDSKVSDPQIKLTRLLQYTKGPAKAAIKNCALVGNSAGYVQARDILKRRFGNSHLVSQQIVNDLKNGKMVSKPHELRQLGDDLTMAVATFGKLELYERFNTQEYILDILQRCQGFVRNKWKQKALSHKRETDTYPSLSQFAEFINVMADEACDPVYGLQSTGKGQNVKSTSCNVAASESKYPVKLGRAGSTCVVCGEGHRLFYCEEFKGMKPECRLEVVKRHKLCFNCLLGGHGASKCFKQSICSVPGCGLKHTKFIHVPAKDSQGNGGVVENSECQESSVVMNGYVNDARSKIYLPNLPVVVDNKLKVTALLDSGSDTTFVTERVALELGLEGDLKEYTMSTLGGTRETQSKVVSLSLTSPDGRREASVTNVMVVPRVPVRQPPVKIEIDKFPYFKGIPLNTSQVSEPDILIGMDNAWLLKPLEVRGGSGGNKHQPYATRTYFGWSVNGPISAGKSYNVGSCFASSIEADVERLWMMENECEDRAPSQNDQKVINLWDKETQYEDGHYVLPIPWRGEPNLPNNRDVAERRLRSLYKRLVKSSTLNVYSENISDLIKKGYAEYVPEIDIKRDDGKVWYLPHHAVTSKTKPGKVRVVFDCAAQKNGVSLNSQCLQGPDLNNKLIHVLLRIRQYHYAITADIEAMYHQVKIPISDRDALRFLWYVSDEIRELRMTSHPFGGIWCASSSTYALRKAVEDMQPCEEVKDTLLWSFYVDDMLKSVASPQETIEVIEDTRSVLRHGGFNLTKFMINDVKLLESIDEQDRAKEAKELTSNMHSKVLGIKWDVENDCFFFVSKGVQTQNVTRRVMLSQLDSTYDPLGLVLPIIVPAKILFQEATRLKMSWDENIPISLCQKWLKWITSLYEISRLRFPRCVLPLEWNGCTSELHHFCDASEVAFGACTYLRTIDQDGKVHVALLASKARVAPIKGVTIPRLEISAAVEAAKLDVVVKRELDIPLLKSNFWSDSTIALAYIQNETRRFKTFVANRVTLIRQVSEANQWHHVSGDENPADVLSRGCFVDNLPASWFNGPPFLSNYKCAWPAQDNLVGHLQDEDPEVRREVYPTSIVQMCQSGVTQHPIDTLIEHYSSLYRLKKAVGWWLRLIQFLKKKIPQNSPLEIHELKHAENLIVKHVQGRAYFHETKNIEAGKTVLKSSSIYKLSPILIDGLLVVGGRLKHAALNG